MSRARIATVGLLAAAAGALASTALPQHVQQALTAIDTIPTKTQLDLVFPTGQALVGLSTIAQDSGVDPGIRLRAIYALAKYCGDPQANVPCTDSELAHQALVALVADHADAALGHRVLLLRAAIETLGPLRVAGDVDLLVPLLDHPSRDIRASTARALRDLCNNQAITPLRVRYNKEMGPQGSEQVKLAISEALRILGQCSSGP